MTKKVESGKMRLIKGSLLYAWEELKTMNMVKIRALGRIISGYIGMKFASKRDVSGHSSDFSLNDR